MPTILFFETSLEDSHCYHLYWILQYSASVSSIGAKHINTIGAVCNFSIGCNYKVLYCIKLQIVSSLETCGSNWWFFISLTDRRMFISWEICLDWYDGWCWMLVVLSPYFYDDTIFQFHLSENNICLVIMLSAGSQCEAYQYLGIQDNSLPTMALFMVWGWV